MLIKEKFFLVQTGFWGHTWVNGNRWSCFFARERSLLKKKHSKFFWVLEPDIKEISFFWIGYDWLTVTDTGQLLINHRTKKSTSYRRDASEAWKKISLRWNNLTKCLFETSQSGFSRLKQMDYRLDPGRGQDPKPNPEGRVISEKRDGS